MAESFKDLEHEWYQVLKDSGYLDIEDTSNINRPLKEWHSFKMVSERFQEIKDDKSQYQRQIDEFYNHPSFPDICKTMVKHGNCKFEDWEVKLLWGLHVEGVTTRGISVHINRAKSSVHDILKGLREWMKLL